MNRKEFLKNEVLKKFGSINAFANHRKQDLNSWIVVRTLNGSRKKDQERFLNIIERSINDLESEKEIPTSTREFIRRTILNSFGSRSNFNREFPQFSKSFISNVINGKKKIFDNKTRALLAVVISKQKT